jgi:outer membrane lipoprotein SlyB
MHPLMVAATIAIILVCGLSAAALLGWLPSSTGRNTDPMLAKDLPAVVERAAPAKTAPSHHSAGVAHNSQAGTRVATAGATACSNCGVIDAINPVDTRGEGTAVGTAGGAILGGLLGNQVGSGNGRKLATVAGAIGGAMAGNQIEGNMKSSRSFDIVVRLNDGSMRSLHQTEQPAWRVGDHVRIVDGALRSNG